jgi:restriction endonuclease S subunit
MKPIEASKEHLSNEGAALVPVVPAGTLVMSFKLSIGRTAIAAVELRTNEAIAAFTKLRDDVNVRYLGYALQEHDWGTGDGANDKLMGATLNKAKLSSALIPIPPLDEQKRIVAKLDAATRASNKLLNNLDKQESLTRSLSTSVAAKALSELSGAQVPLEEVASVDYGTRVTRKGDGGTIYPVYGGGGETFRTDSWNREDCFIVSRFAMSEECVRFVGGKFFLNDSGLSVSTREAATLRQDFLDTYLLAKSADIYALGRGTAQHNLDVPAFKAMPIPIPPPDEQERFVEKIAGLRREIEGLSALQEEKRTSLGEFNKAILSSLLQERP